MGWRDDDSTVKQRDFLLKMYKALSLDNSKIRTMTKGEAFDAIQEVKPRFDDYVQEEIDDWRNTDE